MRIKPTFPTDRYTTSQMLLRLISCNVFLREACWAIARSPHTIDPDFLELGEHQQPDRLRQKLQQQIDETEQASKPYDAILLLYGLCGNAAVGLQTRTTRLVIPRAHDCCTILLGSRQRFQEEFGANPSQPFGSVGYQERGSYFVRTDLGDGKIHYGDQYAALVEQYGEDNARYIWETMHPEELESENGQVAYIDVPETAQKSAEQAFRDKIAAEGRTCRYMEGDIRLIRDLILGNWDGQEFLVVEPGQRTTGVYDSREIIRANSGSREMGG